MYETVLVDFGYILTILVGLQQRGLQQTMRSVFHPHGFMKAPIKVLLVLNWPLCGCFLMPQDMHDNEISDSSI